MVKVLNLYAGIGGNRRLWRGVEVTAVERDPRIAEVYRDHFPDDRVIVADAHEYLLRHFQEYDFIWSSPPCQTHSRIRKLFAFRKYRNGKVVYQNKPVFPDMRLYQEIIFLQHYFKGPWVVENVLPYYEPLIEAQRIGRHYFWANFRIPRIETNGATHFASVEEMQRHKGFDLSQYSLGDKRTVLRNCVESEIGLHVLNQALEQLTECGQESIGA